LLERGKLHYISNIQIKNIFFENENPTGEEESRTTEENPFINILGFAAQRRRLTSVIFQEYLKISGEPIEETLKSEVSEDIICYLLEIGFIPLSII
jgi:hypothetical protein